MGVSASMKVPPGSPVEGFQMSCVSMDEKKNVPLALETLVVNTC